MKKKPRGKKHFETRERWLRFLVMNFTKDYEYRQNKHVTRISARKEILNFRKVLSNGEWITGHYFKGINGPEKLIESTCTPKMSMEFGEKGE